MKKRFYVGLIVLAVGHEVQHVSMNASGDVTATFDKMRLTCG
jgi:hypothetical protein